MPSPRKIFFAAATGQPDFFRERPGQPRQVTMQHPKGARWT